MVHQQDTRSGTKTPSGDPADPDISDDANLADETADADDAAPDTSEALRTLALEHGFSYQHTDPGFARRFTGPPFDEPAERYAYDVVTSQRGGVPVAAFRLQVVGGLVGTYAGQHKRTFSFGSTVLAEEEGKVELAAASDITEYLVVAAALAGPLASFSLVPHEYAVDGDPFGYVFEAEDPDIAERYEVYAVDGAVASAVLHLEAVERLRKHRTVDWRIEGRDVVVVERLGELECAPDEVLETMDALAEIVNGIPAELYDQYAEAEPYPPAAGAVVPADEA